jgi:hypothetical protein
MHRMRRGGQSGIFARTHGRGGHRVKDTAAELELLIRSKYALILLDTAEPERAGRVLSGPLAEQVAEELALQQLVETMLLEKMQL